MLALPVAYLAFFVGYPVFYNFLMSFQQVTLGNIAAFWRPFVGADNYRYLFADPIFPKVLANSALFVGGNVLMQLLFGLGLALLFSLRFPGAGYFRGLVLAGWMLPPLVIGALWKWMFATEFGVVNYFLAALGFAAEPVYWLSDPATALFAVTAANIWFGLPFNMILISAGLNNIPDELYEAASLDGAGRTLRFWFVTLPLLRATLLAVVCLSTIYTMRAFDLIWAMTKGGPIDSTNVFPLWSYQLSFDFFRFGPGAAVATLSFAVVFCVSLLYIRSLKREENA